MHIVRDISPYLHLAVAVADLVKLAKEALRKSGLVHYFQVIAVYCIASLEMSPPITPSPKLTAITSQFIRQSAKLTLNFETGPISLVQFYIFYLLFVDRSLYLEFLAYRKLLRLVTVRYSTV